MRADKTVRRIARSATCLLRSPAAIKSTPVMYLPLITWNDSADAVDTPVSNYSQRGYSDALGCPGKQGAGPVMQEDSNVVEAVTEGRMWSSSLPTDCWRCRCHGTPGVGLRA